MDSWILSFAWRDSRGSRRRMLLYISSMILGVAALVSINSFGYNLKKSIDAQAETLLGADLSFEGREAFSPEVESVIDSLGGLQSRRTSFSSMAYFPKTSGTANAVMGSSQFALGAVVSLILSQLHNGTQIPMFSMIFITTALGLLSFYRKN